MFDFLSKKNRSERAILKGMLKQARAQAEAAYAADRRFRAFKSEDVTIQMLNDLVNACAYDLKVTHKFPDGHELVFERQDTNQALSRLDSMFGGEPYSKEIS